MALTLFLIFQKENAIPKKCIGHFLNLSVSMYVKYPLGKSAFLCYNKISERSQLQDFFWFMVSEDSVPGHLAPLFLGHGEAEYHGRKHLAEQS
jgi:hypothetical protein